MTLQEIAEYACGKVGLNDDESSITVAKTFANRRYQLAWDSHPWRDAQITATVTVASNTNSIDLPATVDRIIAARANSRFLDPVDSTYLMQVDPTIFERSGRPTVYEEFTDSADSEAKKIKVFPKPTVHTPILLIGKRIKPELTDDDEPILRNIDNALIAYVQGDLLQRMRQYGKAKEMYEEAGALLEAAKSLETNQANRPRRAKNLTLSGNSLAELADAVCARIGDWGLDTLILAKELLRRNYQTVYDSALWKESTVIVSVESDGVQIVLPEYVDRVLAIRADAELGALMPVDTNYVFGIAPSVFEETTGPQLHFTMLAPCGVKVLPPGREKLTLVSDDSGDKGYVYIMGEDAGDEVRETVTLNGVTPVESANNYDVPITISKGATLGTITVTGSTSTVELQRLLYDEIERKHIRLWLLPENTTGTTCLILGKRRIRPLATDEDTPLLRDVQSVLIELTVGDLLSKSGNAAGAKDARDKAAMGLKILMDLETRQAASVPRVFPITDGWSGADYTDDWFISKS